MNELCSFYRVHLPLYAEDELRDPALAERVRVHVLCCSECQDWLEEYEDLTDGILSLDAASLDALPYDTRVCASAGDVDGEVVSLEPCRTDRIMAAVRDAARRRARAPSGALTAWRSLAAAVLVGLATFGVLALLAPRAPDADEGDSVARVAVSVDSRPAPLRVAFVAPGSAPLVPAAYADDQTMSRPRLGWVLGSGAPHLDGEVDLYGVVWDDAENARRVEAASGDARLILRRGGSDGTVAVRWILRARARELYHDRAGGGWAFLVPERDAGWTEERDRGRDAATEAMQAVPFRRIAVQRTRARHRLAELDPAGVGRPRSYLLVFVPDHEADGHSLLCTMPDRHDELRAEPMRPVSGIESLTERLEALPVDLHY